MSKLDIYMSFKLKPFYEAALHLSTMAAIGMRSEKFDEMLCDRMVLISHHRQLLPRPLWFSFKWSG